MVLVMQHKLGDCGLYRGSAQTLVRRWRSLLFRMWKPMKMRWLWLLTVLQLPKLGLGLGAVGDLAPARRAGLGQHGYLGAQLLQPAPLLKLHFLRHLHRLMA